MDCYWYRRLGGIIYQWALSRLIIPRGNNVFPLCIKWASRAFLTASSLLGNLFEDIYFFAFFCLLLHRFAVSISLQFNCTDPGQQLGDPALRILIGLLLWTCPHFRYEQITWEQLLADETHRNVIQNLLQTIHKSLRSSFPAVFFFVFLGGRGGGGGELGREKNHDYISRDPHTENHKIHHATLRLYLRLCWM